MLNKVAHVSLQISCKQTTISLSQFRQKTPDRISAGMARPESFTCRTSDGTFCQRLEKVCGVGARLLHVGSLAGIMWGSLQVARAMWGNVQSEHSLPKVLVSYDPEEFPATNRSVPVCSRYFTSRHFSQSSNTESNHYDVAWPPGRHWSTALG